MLSIDHSLPSKVSKPFPKKKKLINVISVVAVVVDRHRTTTTITLDISRVNGQLRAASSDDLEQDQVADYLVAMQQRWEEENQGEHKKRMVAAAAKKRRSLWKKGFFEKN